MWKYLLSWCWLGQLHDTWFVAKSFEVVNFEFGEERENIRLKFVLTTTRNTHHKKIFKLLVFLYYKKHEMYVVYCIPQLHIPSTEISQQMSNLDWSSEY